MSQLLMPGPQQIERGALPIVPDATVEFVNKLGSKANPVTGWQAGAVGSNCCAKGPVPAAQTARRNIVEPLKETGKGVGSGFRSGKLRGALVTAEIALSTTYDSLMKVEAFDQQLETRAGVWRYDAFFASWQQLTTGNASEIAIGASILYLAQLGLTRSWAKEYATAVPPRQDQELSSSLWASK